MAKLCIYHTYFQGGVDMVANKGATVVRLPLYIERC